MGPQKAKNSDDLLGGNHYTISLPLGKARKKEKQMTPKMAKSCKSDVTSEFLDLESFSGEKFSPIAEKNSSVVTKSVNFRIIQLLRKALLRKAATFCYKKRIFEVDFSGSDF